MSGAIVIDQRTSLGYPLPHPNNLLSVDVLRLREAITSIDAAITTEQTARQADIAAIDTKMTSFGLGGAAASVPGNNIDSNTIPTGFYYVTSTTSGTKPPGDNGNGHLIVSCDESGTTARQLYLDNDDNRIWTRTWSPSQWSGWTEIYHSGNTDASLTNYLPAGTGAVATNVQSKLREFVSFQDKGAAIDGVSDDTTEVAAAIADGGVVLATGGTGVSNNALATSGALIIGDAELKATTQNKMIVALTKPAAEPDTYLVPGFKVVGLKFGHMPVAVSDDYAGLHLAAGRAPMVALCDFVDTESGVTASVIDQRFGQNGYGTKDALVLGNYFEMTKRFTVQNIQASYTKIIGISSHSNGDNTANDGTNTNPAPNNGGTNGGIRLAGLSKGNIIAASVIRDKRTAVDIQAGSDSNIITGLLSENMYFNGIGISAGGVPLGQGVVIGDTIIKDAGAIGLSLRYMSHSRFNGLVDATGKVGTSTSKYGIDIISSLATSDEVWRIQFTGGSGVVPAVGTTVSAGTSSAVLVSVEDSNRKQVAAGAAMPDTGYILAKTLTGDFFQEGAAFSAGITATVSRAYSCDGRHRIDATIRHAGSTGLRLGSNCNIVDLIAEASAAASAEISGSFNIVRIIVSDNRYSTHVIVSGNNNIVIIVDNSIVSRTSVSVTGNDNKIIGSVKGNISVGGSGNSVDVNASGSIFNSGSNNDIGGSCSSLTKGAGTGNNYTKLARSRDSGSIAITTNSAGVFTIQHTMITSASIVKAMVRGDVTPYVLTVVNPANTATNAALKLWNLNGTAATYANATIDWEMEI